MTLYRRLSVPISVSLKTPTDGVMGSTVHCPLPPNLFVPSSPPPLFPTLRPIWDFDPVSTEYYVHTLSVQVQKLVFLTVLPSPSSLRAGPYIIRTLQSFYRFSVSTSLVVLWHWPQVLSLDLTCIFRSSSDRVHWPALVVPSTLSRFLTRNFERLYFSSPCSHLLQFPLTLPHWSFRPLFGSFTQRDFRFFSNTCEW